MVFHPNNKINPYDNDFGFGQQQPHKVHGGIGAFSMYNLQINTKVIHNDNNYFSNGYHSKEHETHKVKAYHYDFKNNNTQPSFQQSSYRNNILTHESIL